MPVFYKKDVLEMLQGPTLMAGDEKEFCSGDSGIPIEER